MIRSDSLMLEAMPDSRCRKISLTGLLALVVCLSACGNRGDAQAQALARVNGHDITANQLHDELHDDLAEGDASRQQVLETLIDRQLLQGEALRKKLDRDPGVKMAIERARSEILAQAYLQYSLAGLARPSKEAVAEYFRQHPELFSERKIFDMAELAIAPTHVNEELTAVMAGAKSLEDVAAWLEGQRVPYVNSRIARSATDFPPALAARLQGMKKGQLFMIREETNALLLVIMDIQDSPVTLEAATPLIEKFLLDRKTRQGGSAEVARLRANARLEYFQEASARTAGMATADAARLRSAGLPDSASLHSKSSQRQSNQ